MAMTSIRKREDIPSNSPSTPKRAPRSRSSLLTTRRPPRSSNSQRLNSYDNKEDEPVILAKSFYKSIGSYLNPFERMAQGKPKVLLSLKKSPLSENKKHHYTRLRSKDSKTSIPQSQSPVTESNKVTRSRPIYMPNTPPKKKKNLLQSDFQMSKISSNSGSSQTKRTRVTRSKPIYMPKTPPKTNLNSAQSHLQNSRITRSGPPKKINQNSSQGSDSEIVVNRPNEVTDAPPKNNPNPVHPELDISVNISVHISVHSNGTSELESNDMECCSSSFSNVPTSQTQHESEDIALNELELAQNPFTSPLKNSDWLDLIDDAPVSPRRSPRSVKRFFKNRSPQRVSKHLISAYQSTVRGKSPKKSSSKLKRSKMLKTGKKPSAKSTETKKKKTTLKENSLPSIRRSQRIEGSVQPPVEGSISTKKNSTLICNSDDPEDAFPSSCRITRATNVIESNSSEIDRSASAAVVKRASDVYSPNSVALKGSNQDNKSSCDDVSASEINEFNVNLQSFSLPATHDHVQTSSNEINAENLKDVLIDPSLKVSSKTNVLNDQSQESYRKEQHLNRSRSPTTKDGSENDENLGTPKPDKLTSRLFPIFVESPKQNSAKKKTPLPKSPKAVKRRKLGRNEPGWSQLIIDAGQKSLTFESCQTCGMCFSTCSTDDTDLHLRHHATFLGNLHFQGWKNENEVSSYAEGRVLLIRPNDPAFMIKKVNEVRSIVDRELGFSENQLPTEKGATFFLFVSNEKRVVGCLIAQPITKAYRLLPQTQPDQNQGAFFCSQESVPAICGISRIWCAPKWRRKKIATRLVDCLRIHFLEKQVLSLNEFAFSAPTISGKEFAEKYTGCKSFMVYN